MNFNADGIFGKIEKKAEEFSPVIGYFWTLRQFAPELSAVDAIINEHQQLLEDFKIPDGQRIKDHFTVAKPIFKAGVGLYAIGELLGKPAWKNAGEGIVKGAAFGVLVGSCGGGPSSEHDEELRLFKKNVQNNGYTPNTVQSPYVMLE